MWPCVFWHFMELLADNTFSEENSGCFFRVEFMLRSHGSFWTHMSVHISTSGTTTSVVFRITPAKERTTYVLKCWFPPTRLCKVMANKTASCSFSLLTLWHNSTDIVVQQTEMSMTLRMLDNVSAVLCRKGRCAYCISHPSHTSSVEQM
jgi:hypothetical protein